MSYQPLSEKWRRFEHRRTFLRETAEYYQNETIFHSEVDMPYSKPCRNTKFTMVAQSPYDMYVYTYILYVTT